ncbi:hypothetical protein BU17DRAFT_86103 [Hysterangium stoloniferum]|nr:hypothetical protein BU17DRAFT_86103 [Hysterangium stoloniferum]
MFMHSLTFCNIGRYLGTFKSRRNAAAADAAPWLAAVGRSVTALLSAPAAFAHALADFPRFVETLPVKERGVDAGTPTTSTAATPTTAARSIAQMPPPTTPPSPPTGSPPTSTAAFPKLGNGPGVDTTHTLALPLGIRYTPPQRAARDDTPHPTQPHRTMGALAAPRVELVRRDRLQR